MSMKSGSPRICGIATLTACALAAIGWSQLRQPLEAQDSPWKSLADGYTKEIRPLLETYCQRCHGASRQEAELNLGRFARLTDIRKTPRVWQKLLEMLDTEQMPPKKAKQPSAEERSQLRSWLRDYLKLEARSQAGDPGRVVLRRLSNAEYSYTLRDITGVSSLEPAREFPVDGAAGEGFTNTGDALAMSPALFTKYLDAAKSIAAHAVLLPDGLRFSSYTTRRDWTNEILNQIRALYSTYSDSSDSTKVNLQGLVWDAKQGGRLPVEKYLAATLDERESLWAARKTIAAVASEHGLSPKYLDLVWKSLNEREPSLLLDELRARWRQAKPGDAAGLALAISAWQKALWKFNSVGHIGKLDGPKAWMEPVDPLASRLPIRFKVPSTGADEVSLYLIASSFADGNDHDVVVWQQPKFVATGRPELLLKDLRQASRELFALRAAEFAVTAKYLLAADEAAGAKGMVDIVSLATKHGLEGAALGVWLDFIGIGGSGPVKVQGHFTSKITSSAGYAFIQGWGVPQTPNLVANSSDQHVRIPGNMKPHSVAVHPAPKESAVVGWQSPISGKTRVAARVVHAHPECGDGITWSLELRRGASKEPLAAGVAQGGREPKIEPLDISVREGDVVALVIGPRDNHACDLTAVDLTLTSGTLTWDLAGDVSSDVLASNPHPDRLGNKAVWHFCTEPFRPGSDPSFVIPKGSLLDRWRSAAAKDEKARLAADLQRLLSTGPTAAQNKVDAALYHRLASLNGPLFGRLWELRSKIKTRPAAELLNSDNQFGLDPALFGLHPNGTGKVDPSSLCVQAPSVVEVRVPADLVAGYELITTGVLHADSVEEGTVQLQVLTAKPAAQPTRQPGIPVLVGQHGASRQRIATALDSFRALFPPAVSYSKIVPVDEAVTLTLFYREDQHLARLMLEDAEKRKLDRLWDELEYVSQAALSQVDAFAQLMEYATQDSNPKLFEPLRKPFYDRAAAFRKQLVDTEPKHIEGVLEFAGLAYRRPLTRKEKDDLVSLYHELRKKPLPHEEAIRLTIARVLVSPAFLYRLEKPAPGAEPGVVSDWELASRLSYFLWSSAPDRQLMEVAAAGKLGKPDMLVAQMKRMLQDARVRRLATEFGCQWLHIRDFDEMKEKSERHFPTFLGLRGAMYEESILFFTDLFQRDRPVLDILDADYTFVNEALARHYDIPGIAGEHWRRLDGIKKFGRGGVLAQATTLATQSGASRTSPILRGNWISEVLLGEKLPRPPKGVPQLPDDETQTEGLTVRELIEKHSSDAKCAVCHRRIDAYGFALEGFDAIGRRRDKDLGNRPIDTHARTMDGSELDGLDGLREYLLSKRKDTFVRQFCRKLLGYALARGVQLSDEPLLDDMQEQLAAHGYRVTTALAAIVRSRQFREIRGSKFVSAD
jgi:hypothetical protein